MDTDHESNKFGPTHHPDNVAVESRKWYEKLWLISFLTLALAGILISISYYFEGSTSAVEKILRTTLKEAGFACLVTFFLNISVEWINRRRHADESIALSQRVDKNHEARLQALLIELEKKREDTSSALLRDVFKTVYLRNIPEGIFRVIDNHILKRDVMRRGYKCSITISPYPLAKDASAVAVKFQITFSLCNISDRRYDGLIAGASIDVPQEYREACKFLQVRVGEKIIVGDDLAKLVSLDEESDLLSLVLHGSVEANQSKEIYLEYIKIAPSNNSEAICSTVPMDSLECDALIKSDGMAISASSLHPENEQVTSAPGRDQFKSWRINHAILPGQGIVLYWRPKRKDEVDATA